MTALINGAKILYAINCSILESPTRLITAYYHINYIKTIYIFKSNLGHFYREIIYTHIYTYIMLFV